MTENITDQTEQVAPEAPESPESVDQTTDVTESAEPGEGHTDAPEADPEMFPREYVEKLRKEAADARVRAKRADTLAEQLFHSRVAALGRLADPADLPYDEALLDDTAALEAAVDQLVETKPHLAARRPRGNIGQGETSGAATVDLAGLLRAGAS